MRIPVLPGDGIGPIVIREALVVLRATSWDVEFVSLPFGLGSFEATQDAVPEATLDHVRRAGVALLGAATTPDRGVPSPILALRRRLGLDVLVRPCRGPSLDVVVVGLAREGLYAEPERATPEGAVASRLLRPEAVDRVVAEAFARARRRVTVADKPTVLRHSADLWRAAGERHDRPGVAFEVVNADALADRLVRKPDTVDVLVGESFVADVFSDLAAALSGGIGRAPSASLGRGVAVFEPVHGSAPRRVEDPPTVSPIGAILAAAMLLDHVGEPDRAERIRAAVASVEPFPPDTPTTAIGAAVAAACARRTPLRSH